MSRIQLIAAALLVAVPVCARPQEPLGDADVKKLSELLYGMYPPEPRTPRDPKVDPKKVEAASVEFRKECDRLWKQHADKLVANVAPWGEVFQRYRVLGGVKSPSGLSTVQTATVPGRDGIYALEFTYAYILPNGYDASKRRYPLMICLHDDSESDKDMTGARYLADLYLKTPKELRDQFIFLAPNLGPKSGGKEVRIEFGDANSFKGVFLPMKQILESFAVDNDRIFLEGTGKGGELACEIAAYRPVYFAGLHVRSALPRRPKMLANAAAVPATFYFRKGGRVTNAKDKLAELETMKASGAQVELVAFDPLPPAQEARARLGMENDPVAECTANLLQACTERKRGLFPKTFSFFSDNGMFNVSSWARLVKADYGKGARLTVAVNDADNLIDVKTENIEVFRLFLNDAIVDLSRPVKIVVNGKPMRDEKFERSLDYLLGYFRGARLDAGVLPVAQVELTVLPDEPAPAEGTPPGQPAPETPAGETPKDGK
ncbi:MAG TPA: hypothetical protein VEI02_15885 [Planctomycetota bacterium]|nr:hypothetical protein [Planctomycetota bacterium]